MSAISEREANEHAKEMFGRIRDLLIANDQETVSILLDTVYQFLKRYDDRESWKGGVKR